MSFVHLHGHSTFSFLEAIGSIKKLPAKVKDLGMDTIAVTDYNGMYGAILFYNAAKEAGIKPILGVELWFVVDVQSSIDPKTIGNICLLAIDNVWYHNLLSLVSFANTKWLAHKPKIDLATLEQYKDGIIAFFGWENSWFAQSIHHGEDWNKIMEITNKIQHILGMDNVYGEIIAQDYSLVPSLQQINTKMLQLAQDCTMQCIVDNNYFYMSKKDKYAREAALAIKDGIKLYETHRRQPAGDYHIMTEDEIRTILHNNNFDQTAIDTLIQTNRAVADRIHTHVELGVTLFPNFEPHEDIVALYEKNKDTLVEE